MLHTFRLEPRTRGVDQDLIRTNANLTSYGGERGRDSLRELAYNIANGKDVHITITDGRTGKTEQVSSLLSTVLQGRV